MSVRCAERELAFAGIFFYTGLSPVARCLSPVPTGLRRVPLSHRQIFCLCLSFSILLFYLCAKICTLMDEVRIRDKNFKVFLPEEQVMARVREVASQITRDLADKRPLLVVVLNGAFVFAADLMRQLDFPCEVSFVRMSSYEGTSSTGLVKQLIGLKEDVEGREVVIVEDIIDSGLTMQELLATLSAKHPKAIHIAALLVKPGNLKANLDIEYCCFNIPNDFIVGYGLDYEGEGRNLRGIYVVTDNAAAG